MLQASSHDVDANMKKLLLPVAAAVLLSVVGCQSMQGSALVSKDGDLQTVDMKNIKSFEVEISPRLAVCDNPAMNNMCMQYRLGNRKNSEPLKRQIEGFDFEVGNRYMLDVRQEVVQVDGKVQTQWRLNKVLSKMAEPLSN